jgi:integrase
MPRIAEIKPYKTDQGWRVNIPKSMAADGKRHKKYFRTESDANRYAGKLRAQYATGVRGSTLPLAVAMQATEAISILAGTGVGMVEAAKIIARQMAASGGQETFRKRYKRVLLAGEGRWSDRYELEMARVPRWVSEKFMDMPCGTIDRAVIEKALVEDRELTRATLEMRARMILAVLNYRERHRKSSEIKILTLAEVEKVLDACQSVEERRVVALLAFAGIRPDAESGEIARLHWEAVGAKEIYIAPATSKTGSDRHIPLTPRLRAEIDGHPTEGPVLPANWRRSWQRIRKAAGIAGEQDILRHSFASHYLAATDEARAKAAMGHTAGSSTLFRHYRRAVTQADGLAYFGLKPSSKG